MPELGIRTEADAVLAPQAEAEIDILARRVGKSLVKGELSRGEGLHAEVQRWHVPELFLVRQQPLARQGAVELVIFVQER